MYKEFYGLNDEPFKIAPDPKFFYPSEKHNEGLTYVLYGIEQKKGLIVLTGEIGSGKTILLKTLAQRLDTKAHLASLVNFQVASSDIYRLLGHEFDLDIHSDEPYINLLGALRSFLEQCTHANEDCVLMIDEAQSLSDDVLEQLRLLSNFETNEEKLLQIILVGQRELYDKLNLPEFAKLKQRIGVSYELLPLNYSDTASYVEKRLTVAGAVQSLFTPAAIEEIYRYSQGIPRVINIICDLALFIGFGEKQREIGRALIVHAADTLHLPTPEERGDPRMATVHNGSRVEAVAGPSWQAGGKKTQDLPTMVDLPMRSSHAGREAHRERRADWRGLRRLVYVVIAAGVVFGLVFGGGLLRISAFVMENRETFAQWPWSPPQQASAPEVMPPLAAETPSEPRQPVDSPLPIQTTPRTQTIASRPTAETPGAPPTALPTQTAASRPAMDDRALRGHESDDQTVNQRAKETRTTLGDVLLGSTRRISQELPSTDDTAASNIQGQFYGDRIVIVQAGDTLGEILLGEYGKVTPNLISFVQEANPVVTDPSRIEIGQRIVLPILRSN